MSELHYLNVGQGDCTIIRHASGRVTVVDICGANAPSEGLRSSLLEALIGRLSTSSGMCEHPVHPVEHLHAMGVERIFRFVLTHPEMDHLDGLDTLMSEFSVLNFWDSGVRRRNPDFEAGQYQAKDWSCYAKVRSGRTDTKVVSPTCGSKFRYANKDEASPGGDGLYVLAPTASLVMDANTRQEFNDASYVLLYRSLGGRVVIPGDAHDAAWDHVVKHHAEEVANCSVLLAPHHGRRSDMSFAFLDILRPKLTLFGCAPFEDLAFEEYERRRLPVLWNEKEGCISLEISIEGIDIWVENANSSSLGRSARGQNYLGFGLVGRIPAET